MPLKKGKSQKTISKNISELHKGKTFSKTSKKLGKETANKQAVAIALEKSRQSADSSTSENKEPKKSEKVEKKEEKTKKRKYNNEGRTDEAARSKAFGLHKKGVK